MLIDARALPSPLVGEGAERSEADEGCSSVALRPTPGMALRPAPLIRPFGAPSPTRGEGDDDDIRVYCAPHPLRDERHVLSAPAGSTVAEIVDLAITATGSPCEPGDFVVLLSGAEASAGDGQQVLPEFWHRVRPKAGTSVAMRPLPKGPLTQLLTTGLATALGGGLFGSIAAQLIVGVLALGAKFLLNKLFAPEEKNDQQREPKPSYSITGSRNQIMQDSPVPVILGTHRFAPPLAAQPYTENVGDDQYVRQLFIVGYGPLAIPQSLVKIGETPIDRFEGVTIEIKEGWPGDTPTAIVPLQPFQDNLTIDLKQVDGFHTLTTADNIQLIHIDLVMPQGLMYINASGRYPMGVDVRWEYRKVGTVPWNTPPVAHFEAQTQDVIRTTLAADVAAGQYEVRVQKNNADVTATGGDYIFDTITWTALRSFRFHQPINFDKPVALIAVRIKATGQLNGVIDTLNCQATPIVAKGWNGVTWSDDVTSSRPGDLFRHVLQHRSNPKPVADSRIDLTALQNWNNYCGTNGFTYKKPVTTQVSVFAQLREIAAAGRAMPVFKDGKWSVVWDEQNPPVVQMFTEANSWGFEGSKEYVDPPHAFRMRFTNAAKGYVDDERTVYDDGYGLANATKFERFEMPGVTDTTAIWKHGRYHIAQGRQRPETYTLFTDVEGLIPTRNDRVRVQHPAPLVGLAGGRVTAVVDAATDTVTVNNALTLDGSQSYGFRFRKSDNTYITRNVVAGTTGILTTIPLTGSGSLPAVDDLFAFGLAGSETGIYRVLGVEPQDDLVHRLTLVDDAPGISLADTGTIPDFDSGITAPVDPFELPPADLRLVGGSYEENGAFYEFITASWVAPPQGKVVRYETQIRSETDPNLAWKPGPTAGASETSATFRKVVSGLWTVRIRAVFVDNTFSGWVTSAVYNANALTTLPPDVTQFRIATTGDTSTLSWAAVIGTFAGGVTYQIRFSPLLSGVTWNTASPLLPSISGTSAQVQTQIGTYLIKAQLPAAGGIQSANATILTSAVASLLGRNIVETLTQQPTWAGTKASTEVVGVELRLASNNTIDSWDTIDDVITIDTGDGDADSIGMATEGTYIFGPFDLGAIYTSRISAALSAYGYTVDNTIDSWGAIDDLDSIDGEDPGGWSVDLSYQKTDVDPVSMIWSDWQQFVVGDVSARGYMFKATLHGSRSVIDPAAVYATISPSLTEMAVTIDMPDERRAGNDIVVPVAGLAVAFDPPFRVFKGLGRNDQDLASGDLATFPVPPSETGFTIQYVNSVGSPVQRTMDYVADGYGRQA